jgi:acetylornithine deacetylase/succinyl-diaminopimelate desuccinylase-like protein
MLRPAWSAVSAAAGVLVLLLFAVCGAAPPKHPAGPARLPPIRAWRAAHEKAILAEFADLLAIPNLATDAANIERNAAAIRAMCDRRGLATRVLTTEGAPPLLVADLAAPGPARTIAFYAHYDGQPVDRARWKSDPWTPVMRDRSGREVDWKSGGAIDPEWRLYARSAGDDKAAVLGLLSALDALRAARLRPSVNLRLVFDGEEEAGSPHLARYLADNPDLLRVDGWVFCDGPVHQSRRMQLFFGARGTLALELTVYGPVRALHDGHYGNWVPNPAMRLTHLLDSMRDGNGRITIAGFSDDVVPATAAESAALANIPDVESDLRAEFQIASTEGDGRPLNETLMQPALNVRGLEAGHVGDAASNTIPAEARASIDFRLVPNQTPESVKTLVERHLREQGYTIVRDAPDEPTRRANARIVRVDWGAGYPPARTPLDLPLSREVAAILGSIGQDPIRLPTVGASLPIFLFQQPRGTPVIGLPIANHDDNQHAADENLRLQNLWDGIEVYAALFAELGPK